MLFWVGGGGFGSGITSVRVVKPLLLFWARSGHKGSLICHKGADAGGHSIWEMKGVWKMTWGRYRRCSEEANSFRAAGAESGQVGPTACCRLGPRAGNFRCESCCSSGGRRSSFHCCCCCYCCFYMLTPCLLRLTICILGHRSDIVDISNIRPHAILSAVHQKL